MRNLFIVLLSAIYLCGCAEADRAKTFKYKPPASASVQLGSVEAYKSLKYSGKIVREDLFVNADEHGNLILVAVKDSPGEVSIYLSEPARQELLARLRQVQDMGYAAIRNGLESPAYVGGIIGNRGSVLSAQINLTLDIHESGSYWICILDISGYDVYTTLTPHIGTPPGWREVKLRLPPDSLENLLQLLGRMEGAPSPG